VTLREAADARRNVRETRCFSRNGEQQHLAGSAELSQHPRLEERTAVSNRFTRRSGRRRVVSRARARARILIRTNLALFAVLLQSAVHSPVFRRPLVPVNHPPLPSGEPFSCSVSRTVQIEPRRAWLNVTQIESRRRAMEADVKQCNSNGTARFYSRRINE